MKTCSKCSEKKKNREFNKNAKAKDGLQSYCKLCSRKASYDHGLRTGKFQKPGSRPRKEKQAEVVRHGYVRNEVPVDKELNIAESTPTIKELTIAAMVKDGVPRYYAYTIWNLGMENYKLQARLEAK